VLQRAIRGSIRVEIPGPEGGCTEWNEGRLAEGDDAPKADSESADRYIRATSAIWNPRIPHWKADAPQLEGQPTKPKVTGSNPVGRVLPVPLCAAVCRFSPPVEAA
jgi:hypothetical protein